MMQLRHGQSVELRMQRRGAAHRDAEDNAD
jgi:hypothetical protein